MVGSAGEAEHWVRTAYVVLSYNSPFEVVHWATYATCVRNGERKKLKVIPVVNIRWLWDLETQSNERTFGVSVV